MAEYKITVIELRVIRDPNYDPSRSDGIRGIEEITVYQQQKEFDLNKVIMAVNGYTRTR